MMKVAGTLLIIIGIAAIVAGVVTDVPLEWISGSISVVVGLVVRGDVSENLN